MLASLRGHRPSQAVLKSLMEALRTVPRVIIGDDRRA
jgi:hypothetical protein